MILFIKASYLFLICLIFIALVSCTHVKAWEKGVLAKREMLVVPDPSYSELRAQVFESKEATAGGLGSSGGGCGCN